MSIRKSLLFSFLDRYSGLVINIVSSMVIARLLTPAGSISIGGLQAVIHSLAGPSGWHLLGRTPVQSYHQNRNPMFLFNPGDSVRFVPVAASQWQKLNDAAAGGELIAERVEP